MKSILLFISLFCAGTHSASAQDTIRVMYYNLLNFPSESPDRVVELRQVIGFAQPDILVVNELLTEEGSDLILNEALNVWGIDHYSAAAYIDGPDTDNMLYYNADLLGLYGQEQIPTGLRDISEYKLYYKSPGLGAESDTVFLSVYSVHLKAGSGFYDQRKEEALVLKYRLNSLDDLENILVGGDFNFYSGNESGCLALRETGDVDLFDPISSIGDWSNNGAYADIHTQSTRVSPLADGAGGGMDDRFDLIFVSQDVLNNQNGISFISGSYQALGQDGSRFNSAINVPYNPSVPDSVASALYLMSDHLPVLMDLETDYTAQLESITQEDFNWYFNSTTKEINFNTTIEDADFLLVDLSGKIIFKCNLENTEKVVLPAYLNTGMLLWSITGPTHRVSDKIVIQ